MHSKLYYHLSAPQHIGRFDQKNGFKCLGYQEKFEILCKIIINYDNYEA